MGRDLFCHGKLDCDRLLDHHCLARRNHVVVNLAVRKGGQRDVDRIHLHRIQHRPMVGKRYRVGSDFCREA